MASALRLAPPLVHVEPRGSDLLLRSAHDLPPAPRCVGDWLVHHAEHHAARPFLQERGPDGSWQGVDYAGALAAARAVGAWLLAAGAGPGRPVMVVADNGVAHGLVLLGAMHVGVPVAPVSTAYALASTDFARLQDVYGTLAPAVVVVGDGERYARALAALPLDGVRVVALERAGALVPFAELLATPAGPEVDTAFAALGADTAAKILFTSGSTGSPKGVVNTQGMLTSNQEAIARLWPFLEDRPPVVVDWLPWSHTFGSNHNFHLVLRNGGTLYVDGGRPAPALVQETVRNLREIAPTLYFNVPRGYDLLLPALEGDAALREHFFAGLDLLFYAAAALPPTTRSRLEAVAAAAGRPDLLLTSAWGATETAPLCTSAHFPTSTPAIIGLPAPGTTVKLCALDDGEDKLELRVKGPNVAPGYWTPGGGLTPVGLDAEGFWPTGDAGRLADPAAPERGIVFEGRIGENFKLSSGTWVSVGPLRVKVVDTCAPLVADAVVTGHGRASVGVLLFLSPAAVAENALSLRVRLLDALRAHNERHPGSSTRVARALVLAEPPSLDAGETTDKGYLNQRRLLVRRAADVERLYLSDPDDDVLCL